MLIQYVRDEQRNPIGCMIADVVNNACYIGYSFYHREKEAMPFTKKLAIRIAYSRMINAIWQDNEASLPYTKLWNTDAIPEHASSQYIAFIRRCTKYYKPVETRVY